MRLGLPTKCRKRDDQIEKNSDSEGGPDLFGLEWGSSDPPHGPDRYETGVKIHTLFREGVQVLTLTLDDVSSDSS